MEKIKLAELLKLAKANNFAIPAINVTSFDAMLGIASASNKSNSPIIIQISSRNLKKCDASKWKIMFDAAVQFTNGKCYLALDHCLDVNVIYTCIDANWDMVMFDGSSLVIEENIELAKKIEHAAHQNGVCLEVEVGSIGGEEDGIKGSQNLALYDEIIMMSNQVNADCMAVGFGNIHGVYTTKSCLRWDILEGVNAISDMPLVLHGGTGLNVHEFHRAIRAGVAKVNISTALKSKYSELINNNEYMMLASQNNYELHARIQQFSEALALEYVGLFRLS